MNDLCKSLGRDYLVFRMYDTYKYPNGETEMCTVTLAIGLSREMITIPTDGSCMWTYRVK